MSKELQKILSGRDIKDILIEATEFPFLSKFVKDSDKGTPVDSGSPTGYIGDIELQVGDPYRSGSMDIFRKGGFDRESFSFVFEMDSKKMFDDYMTYDKELTDQLIKYLDDNDLAGWVQDRDAWLETVAGKEWGATEVSGNTYNEDNAYFWGDTFEFTEFDFGDGRKGVVVMFHAGGDVRGNYENPKVYLGDFMELYSSMNVGDPEDEIAHIMGYDGDYDQLIKDLVTWAEGGTLELDFDHPDQLKMEFDKDYPGRKM